MFKCNRCINVFGRMKKAQNEEKLQEIFSQNIFMEQTYDN